jgi:hypothetical protein
VAEKSKNDQKRKTPYRKIAAFGCVFLLLMGGVAISVLLRAINDMKETGFGIMGPGWMDDCTSFEGVHHDFKLAGHVINAQGQPVQRAQVEIGSEGPTSCIDELSSYHVLTSENGEFFFGPSLFAYTKEFFIAVSIEGCSPSILYDDLPDDEPVTIVLDCVTTSTP